MYVKMLAKTLVVGRFGGLWLLSSVNDEGSHRPPKRPTTSVLASVFTNFDMMSLPSHSGPYRIVQHLQ